jgi:glyoxylase-like metal-dependent hydrolase (beta-lactamase superfamily II)
MAAWMNLTVPRELAPPPGVDRLVQLDRVGKGCLGYLVVSRGEALIVDPPIHFESYLELLDESGAKLVGVADTHAHADYVSGCPLLAQDMGVPYYLHPADAVYPYDGTPGEVDLHALSHGDLLTVGEARVKVLHTPGHTEGSVTYLLQEAAAFTGDFLFVESIGRPDLGGMEESWAARLWESVEQARRGWDPATVVYPAHYASGGERRMGQAVGIVLGDLLQENPILRMDSREEFVRFILEHRAPFPDGYRKIKALNLGLAPIVLEEVAELEVGKNECALGGLAR